MLIFASELVGITEFFSLAPSALATKVIYMYSYVGLRDGADTEEHACICIRVTICLTKVPSSFAYLRFSGIWSVVRDREI